MTHEMAKWIIEHDGHCPGIGCGTCFDGCAGGIEAISMAQKWLADHPDPQATRYDWSKAEPWAKYIATNADGRQIQYMEKPDDPYQEWESGYKHSAFICCPDWRDSLEARPKAATVKREIEATPEQWERIEKIIGGGE